MNPTEDTAQELKAKLAEYGWPWAPAEMMTWHEVARLFMKHWDHYKAIRDTFPSGANVQKQKAFTCAEILRFRGDCDVLYAGLMEGRYEPERQGE